MLFEAAKDPMIIILLIVAIVGSIVTMSGMGYGLWDKGDETHGKVWEALGWDFFGLSPFVWRLVEVRLSQPPAVRLVRHLLPRTCR